MGKCVRMVPSAMLALAVGSATLIGCGRTNSVTILSDSPNSVAVVAETDLAAPASPIATSADESTQPSTSFEQTTTLHDPPSGSAVDNAAGNSAAAASLEPRSEEGDSDQANVTESASPDRIRALGQFGAGGGGGMMGGGGGGMMGGGGMGGGMGGMMGGGMGGGMGGMGGGGVSIDPSIKFKKDSSGKLEQRRKEATNSKPQKGSFSADK